MHTRAGSCTRKSLNRHLNQHRDEKLSSCLRSDEEHDCDPWAPKYAPVKDRLRWRTEQFVANREASIQDREQIIIPDSGEARIRDGEQYISPEPDLRRERRERSQDSRNYTG